MARLARKEERARLYAARKLTPTASAAAQAADRVLVASSCQKVGSAMPISENLSSVAEPLHDGGWAVSYTHLTLPTKA